MKKISIENFRVFKKETTFELKPINILVGPNNAGKSSFTKLLQLLSNGLDKLDFSKGEHNLKDFDSILSWNSDKKEMFLELENHNFWKLNLEYTNGIIGSIQLKYNLDIIGELYYEDKYGETYNGNVKTGETSKIGKSIVFKFYLENVLKNIQNIIEPLNKSIQHIINENFRNQKKHILKIIKELSENDLKIHAKLYNVQNEIHKDLLIYSSEYAYSHNGYFYTDFSIQNLLSQIRNLTPSEILNNISKNIATKLNINSKDIDVTISEKIMQIFNNSYYDEHYSFWAEIMPNFSNFELSTEVINTQRGNHNRLIFHKESDFYKNLNLSKVNPKDENKKEFIFPAKNEIKKEKEITWYTEYIINNFHKEILEALGINGSIEIKQDEYNVYSEVNLIIDGRKVNIADMGYGFSQLFPLLFKLFTILNKVEQNEIIIIEEPEANLHPDLQSKIADLLAITIKYFPNIQIVLETHSEYLIRKLQFLTAKKEIPLNSSVIYYFNADKNVSIHEPKVKKIEIQENGQLTDCFGTGFFDEVTKIQFALSQLNKSSNN